MVKNKTKYNSKLQKAKDESNKDKMKRTDFFTEILCQINEAKISIGNIGQAILNTIEYFFKLGNT